MQKSSSSLVPWRTLREYSIQLAYVYQPRCQGVGFAPLLLEPVIGTLCP